MSNGEKKLIYILLIIIAISSCILLIRIKMQPEYDTEMYARIYSEYERMKKEQKEKKIETENNVNEDKQIELAENNDQRAVNSSSGNGDTIYKSVNTQGESYKVDGEIMIPEIKITYPVINETSEEYLKIAPIKIAGPEMNEVGNYCIAGHNYENSQFFSKLSKLKKNDQVLLTSKSGKKLTYLIYAMYEVDENDLSCTNQDTNGQIEATLITCTTQKQNRLIAKCRAIT